MRTMKRLLSYLRYEKKGVLIGLFCLLLSTGATLTGPLVAKHIIDNVITPMGQAHDFKAGGLLLWVGIYVTVNLVGVAGAYLNRVYMKTLSNRIAKRIRDEVFEHVQTLPVSYFDHLPAGKVVSRITSDTESVRANFYVSGISTLFNTIVMLVGVYITIFLLNATLGLVLLFLVPVMILWQRTVATKQKKYYSENRELYSQLSGQLNESIQGAGIVQAFQQEEKIVAEYDATATSWVEVGRKELILESYFSWSLVGMLRNITHFGVIYYFSMQFIGGTLGISAGLLYAFIDYINRIYEPIQTFMNVVSGFQQSMAAGDRVFELMDTPSEESGEELFTFDEGCIEFKDVSFEYTAGVPVLKHLNFTVEPGQTVAFVGHTGSGKSSIMNLLFRFYDPTSGAIFIDGKNTRDFNRRSVRSEMGIVLQDPYLFTGTIASNVGLNNESIQPETIQEALTKVGGGHLLTKSDKGLDYEVKEKGMDFSSGERQLISFARAIVFDPKILILDEATSHIDTETEEIIQNAINVVKEGRTTFMIAHRLSTIAHADQIFVLDKGEIVERGTHDELLQLQGQYAEMVALQKG